MRYLTKRKTIIITVLLILILVAWAPWLDNKAIHDQVLQERGKIDGTVIPLEDKYHFANMTDEQRQNLIEESRKKGVEDGILICDYNVMWFPFGRWVASCEGGYYVTFWGKPIYPPSGKGGIIIQ